MAHRLTLGGIAVDVVLKDIKNIHLGVYPPAGRVRIAAPARMSLDAIRVFAISKLGWIRQQRVKLQEQERETRREYIDRESHYVWGTRYLLHVAERDQAPRVELKHRRMILTVPPGTVEARRGAIVARWYRDQLRSAVGDLVLKWEPILGVKVKRCFLQQMKTKWGSCNPSAHTIRLNTELAKKPKDCLEYIVIHEMVHVLEPNHNARFVALMDQYLPSWQFCRRELNRLPVQHMDWKY
jgi:predicted metal-dependent hydrolase